MASVDGTRSIDNADITCRAKCDPFAHPGLVKEASMYCNQCDEYMCVSCASMHTRFKSSRNHILLPKSDEVFTGQSVTKKLSLSYCAKHGDKEIEWFCKKHEAMFCDTCKVIQHRKCDVMSVSDQKTSDYGQSLADVICSLQLLKGRIENLKSEREKNAEDLVNFGKSCECAVRQFKCTIIEKVERLEREILEDINNVVTTEADIVQDHVNTCDSLIHEVDAEMTTVDEAQTAANAVTSVIAAHQLSKILLTVEPTVSDLEQEVHKFHVTFQPSRKLGDLFSDVDQFGILEIDRTKIVAEGPPVSVARSVSPGPGRKSLSDMVVVSATEIKVVSGIVTGSAVMPNGRIILADHSNRQIILLDQGFNIQSTLKLPGEPRDVAAYEDNAAIVTMPDMKQLLYMQVDTTLRAGHTIMSGLYYQGVAVNGSEIYVTVSCDQYGDHVQVLDTGGNVTRRISVCQPNTGSLKLNMYITVGTGGTLYISHYKSGHIKCYTSAGDLVYSMKHKGMSGPCGIFLDEEGNLLVCCTTSNTIHVLGKDGTHHKVILSSADGVVCPRSVSFRRSDQTLIVTMAHNPSCRAYKLK